MKVKRKIIVAIVCVIAAVLTIITIKTMDEKNYYLCTAWYGPVAVNYEVKELDYKVIGKYKLLNPNPRPITYQDAEFIIQKLPEWFAEHYPNHKLDAKISHIRPPELLGKIKYKFTIKYVQEIREGDIYILQLTDKQDKINVYIAKAIVDDDIAQLTTKEVLIYPFFDEEWHSNIDFDKPYKPGDLW